MPISTLDKDKLSAFGHKGPLVKRQEKRRKEDAREERSLKPMTFVSLHHHSTFSYLDGYQLPEAHARRAAELNMNAVAMTEHGNIGSHVKLEKACRDEVDEHRKENPAFGIKPIFGVELYTGKVGENAQQRKFHLTIIAETQEGYRNLLKLVSLSYSKGFHYEPTVDWRMLNDYSKGLIILSGCQGSLLFCSLMGGKLIEERDASYAHALRVARSFKRAFGDSYYIEVQAFPELEKTRRANPLLARIASRLNIPLVATMDCHYTAPSEAEIQKVLHNVRPGEKRTLEDMARDWGYEAPLCPPKTDNHLYRKLRETGLSKKQAIQSIVTTEEIAQRCNVTLPRLPDLEYPVPNGFKDSCEYWRHLIKEGWRYRGYNKFSPQERARAKKMLRKEIEVIESKQFVDYLLVVRDGIVFAKDYRSPDFPSGIPVGAARGSAAASVACYLLRITEVNPVLFPELVFERFIDESRADPPDIDTDFASEGRPLVRQFYVSKYGENCVNNIGTFAYYKSRMALDDVAKVHKVPIWEVNKIKELLIERTSGDLRASATIEDTCEQFKAAGEVVERYPVLKKAAELEGNVKQFGVHAAGLVVSNGDIRDVCAVYQRTIDKKTLQVVSMDKYDAERQGLLKLDFLGLKTLDVINECLKQMDMTVENLYNISLEDELVAEAFQRNDVVGIFQIEGRAARSVNSSLQAESFKEVCDVSALCRPGPLHNGASNEYINIKRGVNEPELIHPALEDITKDTHYQIVYQEQILRIVRVIGNFDWTHAAHIRRIISKKHGQAEFNREWHRFWDGAKTLHERTDYPRMRRKTAKQIWGMCITAGSYAFNVAHATSYGMLSWWTQWFKQHNPPVFFAASLAKAGGGGGMTEGYVRADRQALLIRDARRGHGSRKPIKILKPHYAKSDVNWKQTNKRTVRAGFAQIDKVGPAKAQDIVNYRDDSGPFGSWEDLIDVKGIGPKSIENMLEWVRSEDPFGVDIIDKMIEKLKIDLESGIKSNGNYLPEPTHTAAEVPYDKGKDTEVVWLGMVMHRNLRDIFEANRARTGIELKWEEVRDPEKNEWVILQGYDGGEQVTLRVDRFKYPRFKKLLWDIKLGQDLVLAQGFKPGWLTNRQIWVTKLWRFRI